MGYGNLETIKTVLLMSDQRYKEKILMSFLAIIFWNFSVALIYGVTHHNADTLKTGKSLSYQVARTSQALWPKQLANILFIEPSRGYAIAKTTGTALNLGNELSPQFTNSAHLRLRTKRVRLAAA